jgi:hypothetical protein
VRVAVSASALLVASLGACSLALDFDDETDLGCPCLPDHVCLVTSDRCVKKNSVEDFKSCSPDAERPDDLCVPGSICFPFRDFGPRCMPKCTPSQYSTAEAGLRIAEQCLRVGTTCWPIEEGGGVCGEGECNDNPNTCPPPKQCVKFNGAGVCFTPCKIFQGDQACLGGQACHPIGDSSATACIQPGNVQVQDRCSDVDPCAKLDQQGNTLVCDRPQGSTDSRRCHRICPFPNPIGCAGGESCRFSRSNIDPDQRADLGLCVPN